MLTEISRIKTGALGERRPPPRQIQSGAGLLLWTPDPDDFYNLMETSLSIVIFLTKFS